MVVAGEGSGTRLLTKKKAPYRQVEIPESLYRYVLMCRVAVYPQGIAAQTTQDRWRQWLAQKAENRDLGYEVAKAIRERAREIERENSRLKDKMYRYDELAKVLEELGISAEGYTWDSERRLREQIEARNRVFDTGLVGKPRATERLLGETLAIIDAAQASATVAALPTTVEHQDVVSSST